MSEHAAKISWSRGDREFTYETYSRDHTWSFDGGHTMTGTYSGSMSGMMSGGMMNQSCGGSMANGHFTLTR